MNMELRIVLCFFFGAIAAALPNSLEQAPYDTIVVGLGSAGVTAATTLAKAGRRVLGLEAQDRIGGRVHTVPFGNGLVELGADWIRGTEKSRTYELAMEYNVTILPMPPTMKMFRSDGEAANVTLFFELLEYCSRLVHEEPPDTPEPVGNFATRKLMEYITENKPNLLKDQDYIAQFLELANIYIGGYDAATSWYELSTFTRYESLEGNQAMSWHRIGYKTFFDIMLNKYNDGPGLPNLDIKLGTEVTQITVPQHPNERVVVKCKDGSTYEANNVIVTVSVGVLKAKYTSLFSVPLPKDKQTAIEIIGIGAMNIIVLSFDKAWWPQDTFFFGFLWKGKDREQVAPADHWTTAVSGTYPPMGASNVLTFWVSGESAKEVETLSEDVVKTKFTEILQRFIGDNLNVTVPQPTGIKKSSWYTNPFTRGSYDFDNLLTPQYPDARAWLGAPLTDSAGAPRVLFAGEATNVNHFSTVRGASETGYREAMRLLNNASE